MRILLVHCRYRSPSGEEAVVEREHSLLSDAGHDVERLEFSNDRGRASAVDLALAPANPRSAARMRRAIERFRPDVVHVHNTWFAASPSVMSTARASGVPVVATLHNYRAVCAGATLMRDGDACFECLGGSVGPAVKHRCVNDSLVQSMIGASVVQVRRRSEARGRLAMRYIAPTTVVADMLTRGGIPDDRLEVIPHFIVDPGPPRPAAERTRTLVYAGRLSHEKGVGVAVEAWSRLDGLPPDARFVIAGEGPLEAELRARAVPGVEFVGRRSPAEVAALLATARVAVVPSLWNEPFGLFYLESMVSGLGVVSSDMGGARDFLAGGAGWLVPAGDAAAMSARFAEVMADTPTADALVQSAGAVARDRCLGDYGPQAHLERLEDLYRRMRNLQGRP